MKKILAIIFLMSGYLTAQTGIVNPLDKVRKIADRVIKETAFEFTNVKQKAAPEVQVVEFSKTFNGQIGKGFAFSKIFVNGNMKLKYGVSYSMPIKIWVNGQLVFEKKKAVKFFYRETTTYLFKSNDTVTVNLTSGENRIVIESSLSGTPFVYLREVTERDMLMKSKFIPLDAEMNTTWAWAFLKVTPGMLAGSGGYLRTTFVDSVYSGKFTNGLSFQYPPVNELKKLVIGKDNTFKKDSYADWNYPNGALMMVLLNLTDASGDEKYHSFVKKYCEFINDNLPMLKKQYYSLHDLRGSYLRIFRKCMLDDAGAPVYPFAEISLLDKRKDFIPLVKERADYVSKIQERLADGTLCRPEPERYTVWCDDLFMSTPLLLRAAKLFNDKKYYDDVVKQVVNFNKYLLDEKTGLYEHGWFSNKKEQSKIFWGRANGWVIWAESEALLMLPKNHPGYKKVEEIFKANLNALIKYQDESGIWHQVMDDKESFGETSCTAMFALGMARGIMNGNLDKSFAAPAFKAWKAIEEKISSDGIVKDICQGTGIGFDDRFYKTRERFDNDPRGLGAVITAGIEINKLQKFMKNN